MTKVKLEHRMQKNTRKGAKSGCWCAKSLRLVAKSSIIWATLLQGIRLL